MGKKVLAVMAAVLTIMCTCFGGAVEVRADENLTWSDSEIYDSYKINSGSNSRVFSYLINGENEYILTLRSDDSIRIGIAYGSYDNTLISYVLIYSNSPVYLSEMTKNGNEVSESANGYLARCVDLSNGEKIYLLSNDVRSTDSFELLSDIDFYYDTELSVSPMSEVNLFFNEMVEKGYFYGNSASEPTYKSSIGYLNNLTSKNIVILDGSTNIDALNPTATDSTRKFTFDSTTTTGVDLTTGDYVIRVYATPVYYKQSGVNKGKVYKTLGTRVLVGDYPIQNNSIQFSSKAAFDAVDAEAEPLSSWEITFNSAVRADTYYFQIVNTSTGDYGGLVEYSNTQIYLGIPDTVTTITPEGVVDESGYVNGSVNSGSGTGTTPEDAELNADKDMENTVQNNSFSEFNSVLTNMASTLGAIPNVFSTVFSFLPEWCRTLFGLSIGATCILILYKLIRG